MNKIDNGVSVAMTEEEIAARLAEEVDPAIDPLNIIPAIKDLVAAMNPAVLIRYSGDVALIGQFLNEGNLMGAARLLQALGGKMTAANDTEALTAAAPIFALLGG